MNRPFKTLSTTALAAVLAASALVPAASAAPTTQAVSSLDSVIVTLNGENVKISLEDYANLLELGKIEAASVKYVQTANGSNYTLSEYSDYLDLTKNVNEAAGELEDKGNKQTVSNLKEGTIVNGEIVVTPVTEDFEVTDIAAINETSVKVTFPSEPVIEESDLTDKTLVLTDGPDTTLTATYVPGSLNEMGEATFALSGDSKLVAETAYSVTSEDFTVAADLTVTYTAPNQELADAIAAAEALIADLSDFTVDNDLTVIADDINAAKEAVAVVKAIDENAVVEGEDHLAALVTALEEQSVKVTKVEATVDASTRTVAVSANLANATTAQVGLFAKDDEGNVEETEITLNSMTVEEGVATATIDLVGETIEPGTYVLKVTADGVTTEKEVALDFSKEDAAVDKVNKATNELQLEEALSNALFTNFKVANIEQYNTDNLKNYDTVAEVQKLINDVNKDLANTALVEELVTLADGPQKALLTKLQAEFENVQPAQIAKYQAYIKEKTATKPSQIQDQINVINAEEALKDAKATLQTAVTKIAPGQEFTQADVNAATAALTAATDANATLKKLNAGNSNLVPNFNTEQSAIGVAQGTLDEAVEDAKALATAIQEAKAAQKAHLLAGGKKDDNEYKAVTAALIAEELKIGEINEATNLLVETTAELNATKEATEAVKALSDKDGKLVAGYDQVKAAQDLVSGLTEGQVKTDLQTELNGLVNIVTDEATFKTALTSKVPNIILGNDIPALDEALVINDTVVIDGNGKTITGPTSLQETTVKQHGLIVFANDTVIKDLTVKDAKGYGIQVYTATGVEFSNVVLSGNTKGGLLVNGSEVTVNNITTDKNGWGGIELDKGEGVNDAPKLTVQGTHKHTSPDTAINPAVWLDNTQANNGWVTGNLTGYETKVNVEGDQFFFMDKAEQASVKNAEDAVNALFVDVEADPKVLAEGVNQAKVDAAQALVTALPEFASEDKTALESLIGAAQELVDVANINKAIADEDATALQNIIVNLDVTDFADLSKAQRAEIGKFMIRASKEEDYKAVTTTSAFKSSVTNAISDYTTKVKAFNDAANAGAPFNATKKKAVIDAIKAVTDLEDLTASQELDLAERIFEAKPEGEYSVKTIAEIESLVNATPYSVQ